METTVYRDLGKDTIVNKIMVERQLHAVYSMETTVKRETIAGAQPMSRQQEPCCATLQ